MATTNATKQTERFTVPWNVSDWADPQSLLNWTVEEIDSLDWENPELLELLRANPAFQPRFLLVLLTFAYATGNCESDEVVELYHREPLLKTLFPNKAPTARQVTHFRRENKGLLKWATAQVLKRALKSHFGLGDTLLPAGLRRCLVDSATIRLDAARHLDRSVQGE